MACQAVVRSAAKAYLNTARLRDASAWQPSLCAALQAKAGGGVGPDRASANLMANSFPRRCNWLPLQTAIAGILTAHGLTAATWDSAQPQLAPDCYQPIQP